MRSMLSSTAFATLLSTIYALPAIPSISDVAGILPTLPNIPTDPKALAAWASARGLHFDPKYVHVPSPNEVLNPQHATYGISSLLENATALPSYHGSIPSAPTNPLSARLYGPDDRYQYTNANAYPWRTVGKVQWSNGVSCTGQMIGPRHVLTVKHCLPLNNQGQNIAMTFSPSFDRGANPTFGTGQVINYVYNGTRPGGECDWKYDHAILIIDKRFGEGLGWFGAELPNSNFWNQKIFTNLGYPGDRDSGQRPYRMDGSQLTNPGRKTQFSCDKYGPIWSDTDIYPGQSGSALWKDGATIWGLSSILITYSDGLSVPGWASGDDLLNMIGWARENFK